MDPNNPNIHQHFSDLSDDFLTNPQFQMFLQRLGNTSLHPPSQHQTPTEFPNKNNDDEERTPPTYHGSNSQFVDSEEENVRETPQYPPQVPTIQSNQVAARASRVWSGAEEEVLIGLYLQISEDAIVGWQQTHYNGFLENDEAGRLPEGGSGYNEADRVKSASKLFHLATGHNFNFHHAVEMLNKDPKWRPKLRWSLSKEERKVVCVEEEQGSAGSGKRSRDEIGDETPTDGFSSGGIRPPDGVKKSKAKRKRKVVASESVSSDIGERMKEFTTVREREAILKQERMQMEKEKEQRKREELHIHKMKTMFDMLQTLKNSPTPLTPQEEAYKKYLLQKLSGMSD
ncbi:uncharacterized protein LOC110692390 [Chenopodium quinoa]|uniref:uncharacterized protein LOC110692390 n=1 Tax=Chenopodium quinoa TaxID=63459 RepID=UPI000B78D953|nr:uncharacterized protein LOC110692390 [Chenopodium quinoa]